MKKILTSDNSLKIISVLIAISIWIYIAIVMDPAIEVSVRDLPIQFVGQEALTQRDLGIISESATSLSLKIKGSRKKMGRNDMKTIIVKADVSGIYQEGTETVPVEVVVPFESQGISSQSIYTVDVKVEHLVKKEIDLHVKPMGMIASGYMAGDIEATPGRVTITGPESAVAKLTSASAILHYSSADVDIDAELPITFHGEGGKEISSLDAIMGRVTTSADKVSVHCPILKLHKAEVKADFGYRHLPEGFEYKTSPSNISIAYTDKKAAEIKEIKTEEIDLDKLYENKKVKVKLKVPQGVKVYNSISEVEISIEG